MKRIKGVFDYKRANSKRKVAYVKVPPTVWGFYTPREARKLGERLIAEARNAERLKRKAKCPPGS